MILAGLSCLAASITRSIMAFPMISWSTFGFSETIRSPFPAASIITSRGFMGKLLLFFAKNPCYEDAQLIESTERQCNQNKTHDICSHKHGADDKYGKYGISAFR